MELKLIQLSKKLSYALRHRPEEFGLTPDEHGFIPLEEVCRQLDVSHDDIAEVLAQSPKRRFEIRDEAIRTLYGHSYPVKLDLPDYVEGNVLYHGTSRRASARILREGLKPSGRQYVHLSKNSDDARQVGRRRDRNPIILRINIRRAKEKGAKFMDAGDVVLAASVPPGSIES
jgi:putative RNA 2'-phosphotransferase